MNIKKKKADDNSRPKSFVEVRGYAGVIWIKLIHPTWFKDGDGNIIAAGLPCSPKEAANVMTMIALQGEEALKTIPQE